MKIGLLCPTAETTGNSEAAIAPRQQFAVESRPASSERAASASDDYHVDGLCPVEILNARRDFYRRRCPLNDRRIEQYIQGLVAARADIQEVAESPAPVGDVMIPATARKGGQRLLASGVEEALN